jgi:cytochrome c biogenesis protein CcdA
MNLRKIYLTLIFIFGLAVSYSFVYAQVASSPMRKLIVFYSPTCHRCIEIENEFLPKIEKEFKGKIQIEYRDITNIDNYTLLLRLGEEYNKKMQIALPVFFFEGKFLNGREASLDNLRYLIRESLKGPGIESHLSVIDLVTHFKKIAVVTIISAGLIDGINPCAFTVIVFFISFLVLQGHKKRELTVIGLSFIFAVFLTYLLIGLGVFNFIYQLKGFWILTRIFNITIGIFSIVLGCLAIFDFFKYKKTGQTEGLSLQLPESIKKCIHYVIGLHYRKNKASQTEDSSLQKHIFRLVITALSSGFLVSLLEAICTGQTYIPTITFILKTTNLKLQALAYLLLYNLMFIAPLLIIFFFALLGVTSKQFSAFLKRHLLTIKILMAVLFFGLGIFLIWKA